MVDIHSAVRVWETTTDTSSPFNLDGASAEEPGLRTFVDAGVAGKEVFIMEQHQTANEWQLSRATITDATPDTYVINQVIKSSNSDAQVTWTAGTRDVFLMDYHGYSPGPQHTITGATTLDESHYEVVCNFASNANVTFPPVADYQGKEYVIKTIGGAGIVTLVDDAGDTNAIEDRSGGVAGIIPLGPTEMRRYRSDGTKWRLLEASAQLAHATGSDADTTMTVNTLYKVNMSSWATSVRTYRLPTTAAVGDRIGIYIVAGNASHELAIRTVSLSTDTIDGKDVDDADFTKLFITGEYMEFECITANTAWRTVVDGRIPCRAQINLNTSTTSNLLATPGTFYQIPYDTTNVDVGDIAALATDDFIMRRDAKVITASLWTTVDSLADGEHMSIKIMKNNDTTQLAFYLLNMAAAGVNKRVFIGNAVAEVSDGDTIETWGRISSTANVDVEGAGKTYMEISEIWR